MAMNSLINWVYGLITLFVIGFAAFAEDITTGNLLPNGTNNASSYQTIDTSVPNITTNGFNTTGNIQNWGQEIEVTGTGGINVTGSLVGITTGDDTTTQEKLNNGVTLNSTTVVQNCEYQGSNWQCGQAKPGQDTYTTTVSILDANGNVLSTVNQVRNNDAGYNSNAYKYLDTVTYTGTGSNQFYWAWEGVDLGHATYGTNLGGPNLLGGKLTMTYDNVVLQQETIEVIEEVIEEIVEWEEEFIEPIIAPPYVIPPVLEIIELEELEEFILEEPMSIEILEEAFHELEEEFEEIEILQVFGGPEIVEEEPEELQEEEITGTITEEELIVMEEPSNETNELTSSNQITETPVETEQVVENEPEEASTAKMEEVKEESQVESSIETEEPTVTEAKVEVKTKEFSVDVADVEAKVKQKIVSVEKQLQAISIIGARAMVKSQVNLNQYSSKNAEMFDNRQIYLNKTYNDVVLLDEYMVDIYADDNRIAQITMNDPVLKYQNAVREIQIKKRQAEYELRKVRGY